MPHPVDEPPIGRRERRKTETRGKLVAAARELIADRGADAVRINEITDRADVGFGSFYNHFASKDAIVTAVAEAVSGELTELALRATEHLTDAAEVLAVAHRTIIAQAAADPTIGWLMVRFELSGDLVSTALAPYVLRDLQRGRDSGRFTVPDPEATFIVLSGALLAVVRAVLLGRAPADVGSRHAAVVLQLLGLPAEEAAEVARRPLPPPAPIRSSGP